MEKTNVIIGGSGVNGNIGSCEIKKTDFSPDSFHTTTIAVNSCTGEIVSNSTYFDWSIVFIVGFLFIMVSIMVLANRS